ncbi:unnamed protein product, partial [Scytosiphon promiscuus]
TKRGESERDSRRALRTRLLPFPLGRKPDRLVRSAQSQPLRYKVTSRLSRACQAPPLLPSAPRVLHVLCVAWGPLAPGARAGHQRQHQPRLRAGAAAGGTAAAVAARGWRRGKRSQHPWCRGSPTTLGMKAVGTDGDGRRRRRGRRR